MPQNPRTSRGVEGPGTTGNGSTDGPKRGLVGSLDKNPSDPRFFLYRVRPSNYPTRHSGVPPPQCPRQEGGPHTENRENVEVYALRRPARSHISAQFLPSPAPSIPHSRLLLFPEFLAQESPGQALLLEKAAEDFTSQVPFLRKILEDAFFTGMRE